MEHLANRANRDRRPERHDREIDTRLVRCQCASDASPRAPERDGDGDAGAPSPDQDPVRQTEPLLTGAEDLDPLAGAVDGQRPWRPCARRLAASAGGEHGAEQQHGEKPDGPHRGQGNRAWMTDRGAWPHRAFMARS